jgi:hypothetical protein
MLKLLDQQLQQLDRQFLAEVVYRTRIHLAA